MTKKKLRPPTPASETRKWILESDLELICKAWENYEGQVDVLESAVGALFIGRMIGYDALRFLHMYKTLRKYEQILGVSFKELLPARTADSRRMTAIVLADKFRQVWKAVAAGVGSEPGAKKATLGIPES